MDLLTDTPYANSPEGWWTPYGGALDVKSGVVCLPGPYPPVAFPPRGLPELHPPAGQPVRRVRRYGWAVFVFTVAALTTALPTLAETGSL